MMRKKDIKEQHGLIDFCDMIEKFLEQNTTKTIKNVSLMKHKI